MEATLEAVQTFLGRELFFQRESARFYHVDTHKLLLPRYPVWNVYSPTCRIVQHRVGWIELDSMNGLANGTVTVDYEGGYRQLPADLERALWEAWRTLYEASDSSTGLPSAASGALLVQGSGDVSKIVYPDGGSVTFDVGTTAASGSDTEAGAVQSGVLGWLAPWAWILSTYRSHSAPTLAFA
jgi:hypothetical protein